MALGTIIGTGIPLSVFAFTKNKYARIASVIISLIGGVIGFFSGLYLTTMYGIIPKEFKKEYFNNHLEFQKLNVKKLKMIVK